MSEGRTDARSRPMNVLRLTIVLLACGAAVLFSRQRREKEDAGREA